MEIAPSILETAKAVWTNIITLKSPQDDDAITLCRCILRNGAMRTVLEQRPPNISTKELIEQTMLAQNRAISALNKLYSLKLMDASWAKRSGDFGNPENKWWIAL